MSHFGPPEGAGARPLGIERPCPVCGGTHSSSYAQKQDLSLVQCAMCSMIFVNPVPSAYASGQFYNTTGASYYLAPAKLSSDYAPVRFERELRLFRKYCHAGVVLDVGCSSGAFLHQLKVRFDACYDLWGTDASGPALDHAESRGLRVLRGDFLELDIHGKAFDAVTFWAVLEHLADPKAFLERAHTLLKSGGHCFVLVPNMQSLAYRVLGTRYRYVYPQHLNYFNISTLSRLVQGKYDILQTSSTHFNPVVIWQDWKGQGRQIADEERAQLLRRTTSYKENPLLAPLRLLYRTAERALGAFCLADNLVFVLRKNG